MLKHAEELTAAVLPYLTMLSSPFKHSLLNLSKDTAGQSQQALYCTYMILSLYLSHHPYYPESTLRVIASHYGGSTQHCCRQPTVPQLAPLDIQSWFYCYMRSKVSDRDNALLSSVCEVVIM